MWLIAVELFMSGPTCIVRWSPLLQVLPAQRVPLLYYRAMLRRARLCHAKLSVRLSVTFRYADHIWKTSKMTNG